MKKSTKIWLGVGLGVLTLGTAAIFIFRKKDNVLASTETEETTVKASKPSVGGTTVGSVGNVKGIEEVVNIPIVSRPAVIPNAAVQNSPTVTHTTGFTAKVLTNSVQAIMGNSGSGTITIDKNIPTNTPTPFNLILFTKKGRISTRATKVRSNQIRVSNVLGLKSPNDLVGATIEIK